jgi:hypothetical protein
MSVYGIFFFRAQKSKSMGQSPENKLQVFIKAKHRIKKRRFFVETLLYNLINIFQNATWGPNKSVYLMGN